MKTRKLIYLSLTLAILATAGVKAQVTIGAEKAPETFSLLELISDGRKALRLPQLTTEQRNALTVSGSELAHGLTIFNTTTGCTEYWNSKRWIPLCTGSSEFTFTEDNGNCKPFPAEGNCSNTYTVGDPNCPQQGNFTLTWVSGEEFIEQLSIDQKSDSVRFLVKFFPNDRASSRSAILMVTSPCGNSNLFTYTQAGNTTGCEDTAFEMKIKAENNNTAICSGGSTYLYLTKSDGITRLTDADGTYIWTLNGKEVSIGQTLVAMQSGRYIVYANKVGCTTYKPDTLFLNINSTDAPAVPSLIILSNEGFVCSVSDKAKIYAMAPDPSKIRWYKDGIRQSLLSGSPIDAEIGTWFAVVEDGNCSSKPSKPVSIQLDPNAGNDTIKDFTITVNGVASSETMNFCSDGSLSLAVTPKEGVTYIWYKDNMPIGQGTAFEYSLAGLHDPFILRCRATGLGGCSKEKLIEASITAGTAPLAPIITNDASGHYLCGGTATLTASSANATSYRWYRNNTPIQGHNIAQLSVTEGGFYTAKAINASGCVSLLSIPFKVENTSSGYGTVSIREDGMLVSGTTIKIEQNTSKTITATINPSGEESYSWVITGATPATATGSSVTLSFATTGTATATVTAKNACTPSATATVQFDVNQACPPAAIVAYNPASKEDKIIGPGNAILSVTPNGDPGNYFYEWKNDSTTVGTEQSYSTSEEGSYYCVVTPKCGGPTEAATSDNFIITKIPIPPTKGKGTLSGKTCFDVALSEGGSTCGPLSNRISHKADFSQTAVKKQTYTFTPSGTAGNVRFFADENNYKGQIIEDISYSGNTATIIFKNVNDLATGKNRPSALSVNVYCVYNDGSKDVYLLLTVRIMDCHCCPGYLAVGGEYAPGNKNQYLAIPDKTTFATLTNASGNWRFAKTGKDLCFYKTDAYNSRPYIDWSTARNCESPDEACHDGTDGWRIPNVAELGAIQSVHTSIFNHYMSIGGTANMRSSTYWSSTDHDYLHTVRWNFSSSSTKIEERHQATYLRCVWPY